MRITPTAAFVAAALVLSGCGGNDPTAADVPDGTVVVEGMDYGFTGVPSTAEPGTSFRLVNASEAEEVHELLAIRMEDGDDRSAADILALPPEESGPLVEAGLRGFAVAFPDGYTPDVETPDAVTLDQPGRYLFLCLLPTGAPADGVDESFAEFLARDGEGGPPNHPETGPPHAVQGMTTEITIG